MLNFSSDQYNIVTFEDPELPLLMKEGQTSVPCDPKRLARIFHEELEVKLITHGSATLMIDGELHPVSEGDIVVVNPYEFHYTVAVGEEPAVYNIYMLTLDVLNRGDPRAPDLRQKLLGERLCFENVIRDDRLCRILLRIGSEMTEKREYWQLVTSQLFIEFFVLLLRDRINADKTNPVRLAELRHYERIVPALLHIHTKYAEKISADELAAICGLSKYYFHRIFKQVTGQTAVDYIMRYRLMLADHMLKGKDITIGDAAKQCGFPDGNYFCRCYKRVYGHTAGQRGRR